MKPSIRSLSLILCILLLLAAVPAYAAEDAPFRYQHDPRLNARAMADLVVDPAAVYGFSPHPEGNLKSYLAFDWTDAALVNGENGRMARIAYHESFAELYTMLEEMTAAGKSIEEIARAISTRRNELRLEAQADNPEGLAATKARNLERYGHEEGPLPDEVFEKYGAWEIVLEKAFNSDPGMDALLGLYDDYYPIYVAAGYVEDEQTAAAEREYAVAAFAGAAGLAAAGELTAFSDAAEVSPWFAADLSAAAAAGVVRGYEDGTLRPHGTIRRIEALALLSRCLPELPAAGAPAEFSDVPDWAKADVDRLSAAGLVEGCGDGSLGADDALTVAQVALLVARVQSLLAAA